MNYFDNLSLKGNITVLGAAESSDFVKSLESFAGAECTVKAPDRPIDGHFKVHSQEEIDRYRAESIVFGVVDIDIMEKKVCDAVDGVEDFCRINDLFDDELIYPLTVARVVQNREKYDILYINGVNSESKRFLARELAKCFNTALVNSGGAGNEHTAELVRQMESLYGKSGMGIRMINTDSDYVETLVKW